MTRKSLLIMLVLCLFISSLIGCSATSTQQPSRTQESAVETQKETVNSPKPIESGLSIDALKSLFEPSESSRYIEREINELTKEFSYPIDISLTESTCAGVLSGHNVIKFSITMDSIRANTKEEFIAITYLLHTDPGKVIIKDIPSGICMSSVAETCALLSEEGRKLLDNITLDDMASIIVDGQREDVNGWRVWADFDAENDTVTFHAEYTK